MEVKKYVMTKQKKDLEVVGVSLLTENDYMTARNEIPIKRYRWWLRNGSLADPNHMSAIRMNTNPCICEEYAIVPALEVKNMKNCGFKVGDQFELAGLNWTVISDKTALCNKDIGRCTYAKNMKNGANYRKSVAKKYMDDWARKNGFEVDEDTNGRREYDICESKVSINASFVESAEIYDGTGIDLIENALLHVEESEIRSKDPRISKVISNLSILQDMIKEDGDDDIIWVGYDLETLEAQNGYYFYIGDCESLHYTDLTYQEAEKYVKAFLYGAFIRKECDRTESVTEKYTYLVMCRDYLDGKITPPYVRYEDLKVFDTKKEAWDAAYFEAEQEVEDLNDGADEGISFGIVDDENNTEEIIVDWVSEEENDNEWVTKRIIKRILPRN